MEYDDPHPPRARLPPTGKLSVAVHVTTSRGRGHIVAVPPRAAQLVCLDRSATAPSHIS